MPFNPGILSISAPPTPSVFHADIVALLTVVATALLLLPSCGDRVNCTITLGLLCSPLAVGLREVTHSCTQSLYFLGAYIH